MFQKKLKSNSEHLYNSWTGFSVAIQVAGILKFLNIIKKIFLYQKAYLIDFYILGFLLITWISQETINQIFFVEKKEKISINPRDKKILKLILGLYIIILIFVMLKLSSILTLIKII
ncbi:hypothetical protein GW932_05070 [archaeon]|nr:hypothetical protein [archaeon]